MLNLTKARSNPCPFGIGIESKGFNHELLLQLENIAEVCLIKTPPD